MHTFLNIKGSYNEAIYTAVHIKKLEYLDINEINANEHNTIHNNYRTNDTYNNTNPIRNNNYGNKNRQKKNMF